MNGKLNDIPVEIVEHIIDQLYDDKGALKACSLTCRTWIPRAWRNLFVAISLASPNEDQIFALQGSTLPFNVVRTISVRASELPIFNIPCWNVFENVIDFRLDGGSRGTIDDYIHPLPSALPRLRSVLITHSKFRYLSSIMRLVLSLPELFELHLSDVRWRGFGDPHPLLNTPTSPVSLRHLYLSLVSDPMDFVGRIIAYPDLSLWSFYTEFESSDALLREKCRSSLQLLDLRYSTDFAELELYPSVQTLLIPQKLKIASSDLTHLASNGLRNLIICVEVLISPDFPDIVRRIEGQYDWNLLDGTISGFHNSVKVIIRLNHGWHPTWDSALETLLAKLLPSCSQRGMVQMHSYEAPIWKELRVYAI